MKTMSPKKRKAIRVNSDWRRRFRMEFGACMVCGEAFSPSGQFDRPCVHEMTPGANREKGEVTREACLVVCCHCNEFYLPGMHIAQQLAYKIRSDPFFFSLDAIRAIRNNGRDPVVVTMQDVREQAKRLGFIARAEQ